MANAFKDWTQAQVDSYNARVGKAKEVISHEGMVDSVATTGGAKSANNTRTFTINTEPVPAPRMTRRDKWLKPRRPCVQRYFDYRDTLQRAVGDIPVVPDEIHCQFWVAMPESWTKKKRQEMEGKPHRTRPDRDNFDKAVCDALFLEDGGVWKGSQEKRWAVHGRVEITMIWVSCASPT